ncbi:hypothetical protein RDI58_018597 [Solanum bulbocastanum]
MARGKGS